MKILVTGGAGFIGSHLVDALVARGHRVTVLDNLSTGNRGNVHSKARFVRADVASPAAERLVKRLKPDVIYHLAAQKDVRLSVNDPLADARVNVLGLLTLVRGALAAGGVKRFIFTSTGGAIYGGADVLPTPEEYPARPLSPYGASKLASELYLSSYRLTGLLPFVSLRLSNVYGPRQSPQSEAGVVAIWTGALAAGKRPIVYGDGKQTRDFVYVSDVVRALLAALRKGAYGTFNVGTGEETSVNTLLRMLRAVMGSDVKPVYAPMRSGEERRSVLAVGRARRMLGWKPQVSLERGIAKTVAWHARASAR
ncbi:NAD-dependent epimerase/dehydratase family protein [Patescibacteria group bacterium]|nr:MAG: NAD-dependent epimerase/dehydratase family protein [Patescibacteria group bacterium]